MKNNKSIVLFLVMALLLTGCQSQEKRDKEISDKFAKYLLQKANKEMLSSLTPEERQGNGEIRIEGRPCSGWGPATVEDSIRYADAIKRYADVALKYYNNGARTYAAIWDSVQKAPRQSYGPGSFINEKGKWEYGDHVQGGASDELRCRANYAAYKETVKALYIARQKRIRNKHK
ncbi:MAG: hypothetical protein J6Y07_03385 [Alphaproteobacteria bacterium]|nr:hypothetical protein [Alphaproteobacteria bacterium]